MKPSAHDRVLLIARLAPAALTVALGLGALLQLQRPEPGKPVSQREPTSTVTVPAQAELQVVQAALPPPQEVAERSVPSPQAPHSPLPEPPASETLVHPIEIYDPGGHALANFHRALQQLAQGQPRNQDEKVRLVFFGASHVASDLFTDVVRTRLQAAFGDGGPGFVLPAKPRRWHHHARVRYELSRGFEGHQVRVRHKDMDAYGLAGVALDANTRPRGHAILETRSPGESTISSITLYYLRQPQGGRFQVRVDDRLRHVVSTRAEAEAPGYHRIDVPAGQHRLELRTHGRGPVRIFGAVMESAGAGVVVDTLGVPGSRARYQLLWEEALFRAHLQRRDPDLVVLAYGTNEAGDVDVPIADYKAQLRQVVTRVRAMAPQASCLLIGPSDQPVMDAPNGPADRPRTMDLIAAQKEVSAELGCGFFDLVALMGGPMSMLRWTHAEPPLGSRDHIHFTRAGYAKVGEVLYDALMAQYSPPPGTLHKP